MEGDGFDRLISTLESLGSADLTVPSENLAEEAPALMLRLTLQGAFEEGWSFERAWTSAINRIQPTNVGGVASLDGRSQLLEARALLEEDRAVFQAAYEGRETTVQERAQRIASAWRRTDDLRPRQEASARHPKQAA